ncbi:MAG: hypothetical protein AB1640_08025 [bacterium]
MSKKSRKSQSKRQDPATGERAGNGASTDERKDRVLQARVPHSLYRELASRARRLRVPVSNLVRNILEDSTRMVGNILDGSLEIAETLGRGADQSDLKSVLGWQTMTANRHLACSSCGGPVPKGQDAYVSVGSPDGRTLVICESCRCKL